MPWVRHEPAEGLLSDRPGIGAWAFTFSYGAAAADALVWLAITKPPDTAGHAVAVIALLTALSRG